MSSGANTVISAAFAALIMFVMNIVTLFTNDPNMTFSMISQATWVSLIGGALAAFLKDHQTIATRRLANKVTGTGDGGGTVPPRKGG